MLEQILDTTFAEFTFYGSLALFACLERLLPRREDRYSFVTRWVSNFSLLTVELLIRWVLVPGGLIALAAHAQSQGWGLLHAAGLESVVASIVATILLFDLVKYWEHRLFHRQPWLWRVHVVHHADLDVDFTTTLRHHPFEVLISIGVGALAVVLLGLSPAGIFAYSVLAPIVTTMSHANIRWNKTLDRLLRLVVMTRDAHAVHHSARREETDSNYGVVFIWWDYFFGSYRAAPALGLDRFQVGVEYFRTPQDLTISHVLTMPFRLPKTAISSRCVSATKDRSESAT